ncbi:uncharacterized protein LOC143127330 isoform X2 [Alosa pseudoharengus]|uniref:uncharacterized protein LOC143127330 isoform X2 n=1 Tax=Alosa pseudoharengus TaxID=34774 RepID=UPI003F8BE44E
MSEATCSAENLISLLQEYKQSLKDVSQFSWTSPDSTSLFSDHETVKWFAHLLKVADEIHNMLKDGVVFTTLHTALESGLRFFEELAQKNRPDPVQPLGGKKEYNAETLTVLLQKYTDGLKDLDHFTSNLEDGSNETVKDIRAVIAHLLELGEDMKDSFTDQTENHDTWSNLGHTLESGLKLIKKLLKKIRPDPVQELGLIEISNNICCVLGCYRKPLETHKDEVDARIEAIGKLHCTEFFRHHKEALEHRLPLLGPILSKLEKTRVLRDEERQDIDTRCTEYEKNRTLLRMLWKKGITAQQTFYDILKEVDPHLVESLKNPVKHDLENKRS